MAERIVYLLEVVDVDEMDCNTPSRRWQHRQRALESFNQSRTVGKPGQNVVVGEEPNTAVGLLLLAGAPVPGDGRDAESECRQAAKRDRC